MKFFVVQEFQIKSNNIDIFDFVTDWTEIYGEEGGELIC